MLVTITVRHLPGDQDQNFDDFNWGHILDSDQAAIRIAKYFSAQNKTYYAKQGVTLDTCSIHSNGDKLGIRIYHKSDLAKNRRGSLHEEFDIDVNTFLDTCEGNCFVDWCDNLANDAVDSIVRQLS